jgi:probable phosphoglycerate mutase
MAEPRVYRQVRFAPPGGSTELLLVRHGESEESVAGESFPLVDGQGDPALSSEGANQAADVCARLAGQDIDAIYVSTLRRTAATAEPLARRLGMAPVVERDLREVHLGEWEGGVYREKVIEGDPLGLRILEEQRWDVIPGAEPAETFSRRVRGAVERIAAAHPDQRVAVFAHGGTIGEILHQATGSQPFAFMGADNASISHVVVSNDRWILRRFNDTSHLSTRLTARPQPLT